MHKLFDYSFMWEVTKEVIKVLPVTLLISIIAFMAGLLLGGANAYVQKKRIPLLKQVSHVYLSFMRGTPMIVQLYLVYFGLPVLLKTIAGNFGLAYDANSLSPLLCVFVAFSLNAGAFLTAIIRTSLDSVEPGQWEAGQTIGLTKLQCAIHIIWPQALRFALPLLSSNATSIIKGTSLAFSVSVVEVTSRAMILASSGLKFSEAYLMVALLYFVVCKVIEQGFSTAEKRLRVWG